jgi:glycosyltransferase involved in cell wall biosynthesis
MVGIVMPYFNEQNYVHKSIAGILKQDYTDWHLYVVDDGSYRGNRFQDNVALRPEFELKTTIVLKPNGGLPSARNAALYLIRENPAIDYVAYCDSDDVWEPGYLASQISFLSNHQCPASLAYSNVHHRFPDGSEAIPFGLVQYDRYPGLKAHLVNNFFHVSGVVHKVACCSKFVGDFDPAFTTLEDWDYWVRIAKSGFKLEKNPNAWITYTVKPNNLGSKINQEAFDRFYRKHT